MRIFVPMFCFFYLSNCLASLNGIQQNLDNLIDKAYPNATIGVVVKDSKTEDVIYQRKPNKILNPASNVKLFTATAALNKLGQDFRFNTILAKKGNDVFLYFAGSPSLTAQNLRDLIAHIPEAGIKEIKGNIILDNLAFKPPYYAPGESNDDQGWYYAAPSTSIILNENSVAFDFISGETEGHPIKVNLISKDSPLTLENELTAVPKEYEKNHCNLNLEIKPHNTIRLYGCLPISKNPQRMMLSIPNPDEYAISIINSTLQSHNIKLKGKIIFGSMPKDAQILVTYSSPKLPNLVKHMLEESDNLYAASLTKALGIAVSKEGTYKQGAFAIREILSKTIPMNWSELVLADGEGTRYNLISAQQIIMLLEAIYKDSKLNFYMIPSLPTMGVSGTLKERMKDTPLKNQVWAKTGTMHDISALSGYMQTKKGTMLTFSIIVNGIANNIHNAKEFEEKLLLTLYDL